MIPDFNEYGCLPPGVYRATLDEVERRFGRQSEIRRVQMASLRWLVDLAKQAGVRRLVINGSFVTDIIEPNDVDCVLLMVQGFPEHREAEPDLAEGLPFLDIHLVDQEDFDFFAESVFATDRHQVPKGMVEVIL